MNRTEVRDALFPNCPIRNILSRIGDKWSLLVLFTLETNSTQRFKELQRNIPDISQKMLTATLKTPDKGKSLLPHIDSLLSWAMDNMGDILEQRKHYLLK